jgi:hypothetical protein
LAVTNIRITAIETTIPEIPDGTATSIVHYNNLDAGGKATLKVSEYDITDSITAIHAAIAEASLGDATL